MIYDVDSHRHPVGSGWARGSSVLALAKMFGNRWDRVHKKSVTTEWIC